MKKGFTEIEIAIIFYEKTNALMMSTQTSSSSIIDDPDWTPFF